MWHCFCFATRSNRSWHQRCRFVSSLCLSFTDVPPTESSHFPGRCPVDPERPHYGGKHGYTWLPFKGHCYLFLTERLSWSDASVSCARHGKDYLGTVIKYSAVYSYNSGLTVCLWRWNSCQHWRPHWATIYSKECENIWRQPLFILDGLV